MTVELVTRDQISDQDWSINAFGYDLYQFLYLYQILQWRDEIACKNFKSCSLGNYAHRNKYTCCHSTVRKKGSVSRILGLKSNNDPRPRPRSRKYKVVETLILSDLNVSPRASHSKTSLILVCQSLRIKARTPRKQVLTL